MKSIKLKAAEAPKEWTKFVQLFLNIKERSELETLFDLFLTMNEREMLTDRYRLVTTLLKTDLSQREISERLGLSISKITAGSKATQLLPDEYKNIWKRSFVRAGLSRFKSPGRTALKFLRLFRQFDYSVLA